MLDDYRWLVSRKADKWLEEVSDWREPLPAEVGRLRKSLSGERVRLLLEQAVLRQRGRRKFAAADRMFFTRLGLEQATDETVATYKASRFPAGQPLIDLCTGIGGDLVALGRRGPVVGVDRDEVTSLVGQANCQLLETGNALPGAVVHCQDAATARVADVAAWHIDPDRRPHGRRTTWIDACQPGRPVIERLLAANENAAVKLAPAAELPEEWSSRSELEWISRGGQCRQLVAWFGMLAPAPGRRRATIVGRASVGDAALPEDEQGGTCRWRSAAVWRTVVGDPTADAPPVAPMGRFLFEPDAAVLAAGLAPALSSEHRLFAIAPRSAWLTSDRPLADPALACFEVTDVLPFDLRRLRALLRARDIGRLEIKQRGPGQGPEQLRRRLGLRGGASASLLITRVGGCMTAVLGRRVGG